MAERLRFWPRFLVRWLPLAVMAVGVIGFAWLAVQQSYRLSANDPQLQLAREAARQLDEGSEVHSALPAQKVDINSTLAPFVMILDKNHDVIASNLSTDHPQLPPTGFFDDAASSGERWATWQDESGHRYAMVVEPYSKGFVLAARSLHEVEVREDRLMLLAVVAMACTLGATAVLVAAGLLLVG